MQGEMENKMVADRRSPEWMGLRVVGKLRFARSPGCGFAEAKRGHKVDQALRARPSISIS